MKKDDTSRSRELRAEVREAAAKGASVEFKPSKDSMVYHFSLRDWSPSGLGILVQKSSDIFRHLDVGQEIIVKLHKGPATLNPDVLKAEIRHMSTPAEGQHPDHTIVGLSIIERITE
ncbi:MAG: hypothetical protein V6Z89_25245 [Desulfobacter sp.]